MWHMQQKVSTMNWTVNMKPVQVKSVDGYQGEGVGPPMQCKAGIPFIP